MAKVSVESRQLEPAAADLFKEMGVRNPTVPPLSEKTGGARLPQSVRGTEARTTARVEDLARTMAQISIVDIGVFFAVLLAGFCLCVEARRPGLGPRRSARSGPPCPTCHPWSSKKNPALSR